jgi:hypothetical protein
MINLEYLVHSSMLELLVLDTHTSSSKILMLLHLWGSSYILPHADIEAMEEVVSGADVVGFH